VASYTTKTGFAVGGAPTRLSQKECLKSEPQKEDLNLLSMLHLLKSK